jgi:16S rRNA (guanine527-N7)-methyltransferase
MLPENRSLLEIFFKQNSIGNNGDTALQAFQLYMDELLRWNQFINLTAIEKESDIIIKHFIDSLTPLKFIRSNDFVLDIGSGAGFPGLPIKIVQPSVKIVMLDARLKKINFINNMIGLLKMKGATALHQRAEEKNFQGVMSKSFDVVISRASFSLQELAELSLPYLKDHGKLIAMKSKIVEDQDTIPGLKQTDEFITSLPDGSFRRILVFGKV